MKRRLSFVAPILPFRGGIAQHSTMLHRTLCECEQVDALQTISFVRQYPRWLYPGSSDRDVATERHREPGVQYSLDSLDPRTWERAIQSVLAFAPHHMLIPWWTTYWSVCFGYLTHRLRRNGVPTTLFCHNVSDHEAAPWKHRFAHLVTSRASSFVVHTRADARKLAAMYPDAKVAVQPHPIYVQFPEPGEAPPPRGRLDLLFFGFVREYKGLDVLIDALGMLADPRVHLTVAGEFWGGLEAARRRIERLSLGRQVELIPRYVSDAEAASLFARCDLVALPYLAASGSGVIPLAYRYGKPVLATRVGGLPDVVVDGKSGFLVPPGSAAALARTLESTTRESLAHMPEEIARLRRLFTWEALAEVVLAQAFDG